MGETEIGAAGDPHGLEQRLGSGASPVRFAEAEEELALPGALALELSAALVAGKLSTTLPPLLTAATEQRMQVRLSLAVISRPVISRR